MPARWLRLLVAAPLLASGTVAGCSLVERDCVAPVSGTVSYDGSSVPPPGSAVITADLRDGSDRSVRKRAVATGSGDLYTAVRAAVPEATWTTVYGEYERWSDWQ
jgi:hypothetical protein